MFSFHSITKIYSMLYMILINKKRKWNNNTKNYFNLTLWHCRCYKNCPFTKTGIAYASKVSIKSSSSSPQTVHTNVHLLTFSMWSLIFTHRLPKRICHAWSNEIDQQRIHISGKVFMQLNNMFENTGHFLVLKALHSSLEGCLSHMCGAWSVIMTNSDVKR